ncbi:ATPase AAA-type core [Penicillium samsonianum]|uniref:ATPase AAA-type core n=1 Tax=Penicillium samsonianum TaxID=1882272 RepID=UPI0025467AA3|nr:ATPase AAA-type core [Penicillium samsonianum]KAJ6133119.1 ATPase AAA-type core [Penicillium samsonianum]
MAQLQGPVLNVQILGEIAEFERYDCTVWTPDCVFMKFYVRYNDNSKGYVYGCPFICGIVPSEFHLLILHYKIGVAKYLLGKEEWDYTAISLPWQNEDDEDTEEDPSMEQKRFERSRETFWLSLKEQENIKPIRFTPSRKRLHFFLYQGCLLALYRDPYQTQNSWLSDTETFIIYSSFWNKKVLSTLLQEVQHASIQRRNKKITIYRGFIDRNTTSWVQIMSKSPRPLSTLALPTKIKDGMIKDIEDFLSPRSRAWYESCGIPYRRGYLLYGPPGTGKSSICFAIAGRLWLDIYTISLNSRKLDEDTLAKFFQSLPKRCIVLFEDVDNAGISQEGSRMKDTGRVENSPQENELYGPGISLSALLNCLDGVGAQEGRILMMTTNHLERLDPALKRPGRVDQIYHFDFLDTTSVKQLFHIFFGEVSSFISPISGESESNDPSTWEKCISDLSDEFVRIVSTSQLTAAEVNNYLMGFRGNPEKAVSNALDWVRDRREVAIPATVVK